jgi:hypothetical protein
LDMIFTSLDPGAVLDASAQLGWQVSRW